ncbi:M23 family metallopeptidase [Candidatus Poriferisocius sp.]|uniref:M23 family metallopeptidase n=1 Tax=Candidatus Poriferisocius sp. TaxID=3101276 RepID=UPI003B59B70E
MASVLAPHVVEPSDCRSPLPHPNLMPNWPRTYRSGTHQGLDYQCFMRGRIAVAAMDGRVAVAVGDFDDPAPDDRDALLDTAAQLDRTPPHTLTMLYGNYVVLDHGVIDGAGHVVTIYSHLEAVNSNLRIGQMVSAGDRLATIGNRGTSAAAAGDFDFDPHLHWELHVDDLYLAAGLTPDQTRQVYETLFSDSG